MGLPTVAELRGLPWFVNRTRRYQAGNANPADFVMFPVDFRGAALIFRKSSWNRKTLYISIYIYSDNIVNILYI